VKAYARYARCHQCGFYDGDPRRCDLCGIRKEIQAIVDRHGRPTVGACRTKLCSFAGRGGEVLVAGKASTAIAGVGAAVSSTPEGNTPLYGKLLGSARIGFERRWAAERQLRRPAETSGITKERLPDERRRRMREQRITASFHKGFRPNRGPNSSKGNPRRCHQ